MVRIAGVWGPEVRPFKREDIIGNADPDIIIESKVVSEAKRIRELRSFMQYYPVIVNNPDVNRRYADKELAKLNGLKTQQIRILFPNTLDEMEAEMENEMLNENKQARVEIQQDHNIHIINHMRVNPSKVRDAHIEMHKKALYLLRKNQDILGPMMQKPQIELPGATAPQSPAEATMEPKPSIAGKANMPTTYQAT